MAQYFSQPFPKPVNQKSKFSQPLLPFAALHWRYFIPDDHFPLPQQPRRCSQGRDAVAAEPVQLAEVVRPEVGFLNTLCLFHITF